MRTKYSTNRERTQVYRDDGRVIGGLFGDVFRKHVDASRHFLRRLTANAFELNTLAQAKGHGARIVQAVDRKSGRLYTATIERTWKCGFPANRGHGAQIALDLKGCNRGDDPKADQLTLWGLSGDSTIV